ncbi:MAG: glycerol-3-phosphate 1-O-acyltransferase PlsY [Candidatus Omnitrophica bacterium]|nr:glycerol-3-phosphate 1-O-acyltransferase PlsY [Candidatus Omnitrophota bacterium]
MRETLAFAALGFLCGSFPTAYLYCLIFHKKDIRTIGSGNPGATNVFRNFGSKDGWIVLICDALKGFIPVSIHLYSAVGFSLPIPEPSAAVFVTAVSCIAGHIFSPFLKFKGGKGVATGAGVMLASVPTCLIPSFVIWFVILKTIRYMSVASLASAYTFTLLAFIQFHTSTTFWVSVFLSLIVTYTHRTNLKRLFNGTEPKFSFSKQQ